MKILTNRIIPTFMLAVLMGCSGAEYSKRATTAEGPFSARARNEMAENNPIALLRVGEGFEQSGNFKAAQNIYGQAMAADPALVEAQVSFARVAVILGDQDRGLAILTALMSEHPENEKVRLELAKTYIKQGDFLAAKLFLKPLLATETGSAELLLLGGKLADVSGERNEARKMFERALRKSPADPKILESLAFSFALAQEYQTAVALLQNVMDRPSGLISGKVALATVYALSGQLDAAMLLARGSMPADQANARTTYYQLLPRLQGQELAAAVYFEKVPLDAMERLTGRASK